MKAKEVVKKVADEPILYTEKSISSKLSFVFIELLLFCFTFSIMFMIVVKKIINGAEVMFSCAANLNISSVTLLLVGFLVVLIYILLLSLILFLLSKIFGVEITLKKSLAIITNSYLYFTISNIVASILFLMGCGYLGYILIIFIFFITQYFVYKTYYSVVEKNDKLNGIVVAIIYLITAISTFVVLNITLFNYLKALYIC